MKRKPVLVWAAIAALALAAGLFLLQFAGRGDPNSVEHLTQEITIRCSETGDEWTVARGRMERELLLRGTPIDPTVGLVNQKTGRPTGFPVDRDEWDRTIKRLNREAREAETLKKGGS